ncbi:MAG: hypothetical protein ACFCUO_07180 [Rhodospirillales bacterium]
MKLSRSVVGAAAIAAATLAAGNASAAFYIDATVNGAVWSLVGNTATTIAPLPGVGTVTATASASPITQTTFDGNAAATAFCAGGGGSLACQKDGFGVGDGDDEVTDPTQSITVSWANPVDITAIYLLDFFTNNPTTNDPSWTEQADITINGVTRSFFATATGGDTTGAFTITAVDLLAAGFVAGDLSGVTQITFAAPSVQGCTLTGGVGCNDYAVAGVAAVPLPGAVWLFGSGLLAMLGVGYTRRRKPAA